MHPDEIAKEIAVPFNLYVAIFKVTYIPPKLYRPFKQSESTSKSAFTADAPCSEL